MHHDLLVSNPMRDRNVCERDGGEASKGAEVVGEDDEEGGPKGPYPDNLCRHILELSCHRPANVGGRYPEHILRQGGRDIPDVDHGILRGEDGRREEKVQCLARVGGSVDEWAEGPMDLER